MQPRLLLGLSLLLTMTSFAAPTSPAAATAPVYELRIYRPNPGKYDAMLTRFRDHVFGIFTRLGMTQIAYWAEIDPSPAAGGRFIYLLSHPDRATAKQAWTNFRDDREWQQARDASEVNGKLVGAYEAIFLDATDYSAPMTAASTASGRVIEMRTYRTLPGRLEKLDARFREHTQKLFAKHGMTNLGYFHPQDAAKGAGDTLIYFLAHASREAARASWAAFQADPAWQSVRDASQADGPILAPEGIQSVFLTPADFSPPR